MQIETIRKMNRSPFRLDTDLISLRALVAIADTGSFSAAAKKIGRTQSAVSLQIAKLEERIQTKLLDRTSRTVKQTIDGEILTTYARRILELADEAVTTISAPEASAPFRIGFAEHLVPQHLPDLLARFQRAHPKVVQELRLGIGYELYENLREDQLDVVVAGPEGEDGRVLLTEPLVWVGPSGYLHRSSETVPLVMIQAPCSYRKTTLDALARASISWHITMEAHSIQAVQTAVAAGLGISVMPRSALTVKMQVIESDLPELATTSMVAYVHSNPPHPLAERFISFFEEALAAAGLSQD